MSRESSVDSYTSEQNRDIWVWLFSYFNLFGWYYASLFERFVQVDQHFTSRHIKRALFKSYYCFFVPVKFFVREFFQKICVDEFDRLPILFITAYVSVMLFV